MFPRRIKRFVRPFLWSTFTLGISATVVAGTVTFSSGAGFFITTGSVTGGGDLCAFGGVCGSGGFGADPGPAVTVGGVSLVHGTLIHNVGVPAGSTVSFANGVNDDGTIVVGGGNGKAFSWTSADVIVDLGQLNSGVSASAMAVSSDGSVIIGNANDGAAGNAMRAFRWTQATGMESLGTLNGGNHSEGYGVSADGNVVVGMALDGAASNQLRAFRWTQAGGMAGLGTLNGGLLSFAHDVSADGSVVVGRSADGALANAARAFRWTEPTGMVSLGTLTGDGLSEAFGVSADGSVVVGSTSGPTVGATTEAFRWTQPSGMESLGQINGGDTAVAKSVNADGTVVVGTAFDGASGQFRAFRWSAGSGIQTVEQWLLDNGLETVNLVTSSAEDVSADGSVIVGVLDNDNGFFARVVPPLQIVPPAGPSPITSPGLITVKDVQESLGSSSQAAGLTLSVVGTILNGAHSRPLSRLVDKGEKTGWVAGDWGVDHHNSRNGDMGLLEVAVGYHFGPVQMNLALGKTWSDQDTLLGGSIDADGKFLMVEGIIPVTQIAGLYATVTGYGHWGEVDVERGYLNAGSPDFSAASPDSRTWGLRARLDWQNAVSWQSADFTPYVDVSFSDSHLDSFTETGGAFPASFDSRDEEVTELRLGINSELPLFNNRARLLGNLEAAHRFDGEGSRTSGELIGLFSFDLPGSDYDQEWFKAGIGIEGDLGEGKASFMLNGTTEGEMPSAWAAFAYQVKF